MPDDKKKTGKPDDSRINVNQPYEVRDWSKKLGVKPSDLKDAVKEVGPMVDKVRQHLKKKP